MSSNDIRAAEKELREILISILPQNLIWPQEEGLPTQVQSTIQERRSTLLDKLIDDFKTLAEAVANDRVDLEFNRGDWRN